MEIHGYPWWIFHLFLYVYWRLKPAYLLALVGSHCFEGDLPPWRGQPGFYYGNHRCFWHFQMFDFLICSRNHYFNGLMVQYLHFRILNFPWIISSILILGSFDMVRVQLYKDQEKHCKRGLIDRRDHEQSLHAYVSYLYIFIHTQSSSSPKECQ